MATKRQKKPAAPEVPDLFRAALTAKFVAITCLPGQPPGFRFFEDKEAFLKATDHGKMGAPG